ncbi:hypothetical protein ACSFA3_08755 [Variovorax sp. RHLX14]|uniref:hypothetical protein n=1 Tax=Variovorax sp. RHLX14 TaxID=1259731 RepID=UPI003F45C594
MSEADGKSKGRSEGENGAFRFVWGAGLLDQVDFGACICFACHAEYAYGARKDRSIVLILILGVVRYAFKMKNLQSHTAEISLFRIGCIRHSVLNIQLHMVNQMAIGNVREITRSVFGQSVSSSASSQQASPRLGQMQQTYSRPHIGHSGSPHPYENLQGPYYANVSELAPPLPPRSWINPNRPNQNQAGLFQVVEGRGSIAQSGASYSPHQQNRTESASNGFTRQPFDFPQGANSLHQRIAEIRRYGVEALPRSAFHAPAMSSTPSFPTTAQATQRFPDPRSAQHYSNAQPHGNTPIYNSAQQVSSYSPYEVEPQGSRQGSTYGSQQGQPYGFWQGQSSGAQQGQHFNSRPFSGPSEIAHYQREVEKLLSHPRRTEIPVPHGIPMGVRSTETGPQGYFGFGQLPPNVTEFNQFPVGVTSLGTWPYQSQSAPGASAHQAQQSQESFPVIIRL